MNQSCSDEDICALALNSIFGFQPKISHALIHSLGSACAVFSLQTDELRKILGPYSERAARICDSSFESAAIELEKLNEEGYRFIHIGMKSYPEALRDCADAPIGLYVRSCTPAEDLFKQSPCIAIVGTRDVSSYGRECCERIISALSNAPVRPVIVSGLALGVDICIHRAALKAGLSTIGVSPVGIRETYPLRHREDAARMASAAGSGIITDYPPGTAPIAINFLRRNRIIAGMSQAVILVESKIRGGGMMTARLASSYGREVFCVPGRISDLRSGGCNLLISQKIAECISSPDILPEALGLGRVESRKQADPMRVVRQKYSDRADLEVIEKIISLIIDERDISTDQICETLALPYNEVSCLTGMLEFDGVITMDLMQRCAMSHGL